MFKIAFILLVLAISLSNGTNAAGLVKERTAIGTAEAGASRMAPPSRSVHLSSSECTSLGGKVSANSACGSAQACYTTDEKGNVHAVCVRSVLQDIFDKFKK